MTLTPEQIDAIERRILEAERKYDAARKSAGGFLDAPNIDGNAQVPIFADPQVYVTVNEAIETAYEAFALTPVANPLDVRTLCAMARKAEKMMELALKAFTVVEWASGQGFVLEAPHFDADDLLIEMAAILGVEDSAAARAALED